MRPGLLRCRRFRQTAVLAVSLVLASVSTAAPELQATLDNLAPGQDYRLPPETVGAIVLRVPEVTVSCSPETRIDAAGEGRAVVIAAAGVTFRDCRVGNWGDNLNTLDAGIFVAGEASGARVIDNQLQGPSFGIWLDATPDVLVRGNDILGDQRLRSQDRGNGIHLFNTRGARVEDNHIRHTRDGIYIETANGNRLANNVMTDLRYGIHYMYSHDNILEGNLTRRTRTGYALMQSKRLTVVGNRSEGDRNYGILMNFITQSEIRDNRISNVRQGQTGGVDIEGAEGKAVFIYNSLYNTLAGNVFQNSDIGIHLTAGSEDNQVFGNAFIDNRRQVKYVASRTQRWAESGRGNYWSDYLGWDRNQDGIGDVPYQPNDHIDRLLWRYPEARVLLYSPSVDVLRWVQKAFPVIEPVGVTDPFPLMKAPDNPSTESP